MKITRLDNDSDDYRFSVELAGFNFRVTATEDYVQKLTGGKVGPEELVALSFEFLLEREPASSILSEFDLPLINRYFPEYEETIKRTVDTRGLKDYTLTIVSAAS